MEVHKYIGLNDLGLQRKKVIENVESNFHLVQQKAAFTLSLKINYIIPRITSCFLLF